MRPNSECGNSFKIGSPRARPGHSPLPRTVLMIAGSRASSRRRSRKRLTCMSMVRSSGSASRPNVKLESWSRDRIGSGSCRKISSKPVLGARQGHHHTGRAPQIALRVSSRQPAKLKESGTLISYRRAAPGAPQDAADARQQFAWIERLGQIIVGTHLQSDDAIHRIALRSEHQHRYLRVSAQLPAQRQTVIARQHQVQHYQARRLGRQGLAHGRAVRHCMRLETVLAQVFLQQFADVFVVVNDEYADRAWALLYLLRNDWEEFCHSL